jgi:hypothetical protein
MSLLHPEERVAMTFFKESTTILHQKSKDRDSSSEIRAYEALLFLFFLSAYSIKTEGHSGEASPKIHASRDTIVMVSSFPVVTLWLWGYSILRNQTAGREIFIVDLPNVEESLDTLFSLRKRGLVCPFPVQTDGRRTMKGGWTTMAVSRQSLVIGVFEDRTAVAQALHALLEAGFQENQLGFVAHQESAGLLFQQEEFKQRTSSSEAIVRSLVGAYHRPIGCQ